MRARPEFLTVVTTGWVFSAVSSAALPFLHSIPALKGGPVFGLSGALFVALLIGVATAVPIGVTVRRICGVAQPKNDLWGSLAPKTAALFGVLSWGIPVGLILALEEFLSSTAYAFPTLIVHAIIWPVAGSAFGLLMRWAGIRRMRKSVA